MNPVKSIAYAYASSHDAIRFGFAQTGCYTLEVGNDGDPLKAIAGNAFASPLVAQGEALPGEWSKWSMV